MEPPLAAALAAAFASGRIVDGILLLVALEALVLAWLSRRGGRRCRPCWPRSPPAPR